MPNRPRRSWRQWLFPALVLLAPIVGAWALAYFVIGVNPAFVAGLIRGRLAPARTPADVVVPAGVSVAPWAEGLGSPTSLAFGPDGRLYAATLSGQVLALSDPNGDGVSRADERVVFATGLSSPLGLAFDSGDLYVGRRGGVTRLRDTNADGVADDSHAILEGLPAVRHQTDGLAFGPDGRLYIGQGSTSDRGETGIQPLEASILVADRDGQNLRVFASGTRNPYDLAFYPGTSQLFAVDNGRDVPASGVPDELNLIADGSAYGWPDCWGAGHGRGCAGTVAPVAEFEAHAAAGGLAIYTGAQFPEWRNNAFVAFYGSLSGAPDVGRQVRRIELTQTDGAWHSTVYDFATGFDRPLDLTTGPDGALYVADFGSGIIYRLSRP